MTKLQKRLETFFYVPMIVDSGWGTHKSGLNSRRLVFISHRLDAGSPWVLRLVCEKAYMPRKYRTNNLNILAITNASNGIYFPLFIC